MAGHDHAITLIHSALAAPHCLPGAGASAARPLALPAAASGNSRKPALARGLVAAPGHTDPDAAIARDLALQGGLGRAVRHTGAVDDLHAETVLRIAGATLGGDRNAPLAVIRMGLGRCALGRRDARRRTGHTARALDHRPRYHRSEIALPDGAAVEPDGHPVRGDGRAFVEVAHPD